MTYTKVSSTGKAFNTLARQLGLSGGVVDRAYKEACSMQDKYERMLKSGQAL